MCRDLHAYLHGDGIAGMCFCCAFAVHARLLPEQLQTSAVLADRAGYGSKWIVVQSP